MADNELALRRFRPRPPRYPLLDLPLSLAADTALLAFDAARGLL